MTYVIFIESTKNPTIKEGNLFCSVLPTYVPCERKVFTSAASFSSTSESV